MTNPFDDEQGTFLVLRNDGGEFSLWPAFADVPAGWTVVLQETTRDRCAAYVEEHWADLYPRGIASGSGTAAGSRR